MPAAEFRWAAENDLRCVTTRKSTARLFLIEFSRLTYANCPVAHIPPRTFCFNIFRSAHGIVTVVAVPHGPGDWKSTLHTLFPPPPFKLQPAPSRT